ncbi:AbrB/MazE/SpoVT family DNA-binding domain-containing protein [uncultured Methanobrevibacter sp.]|uniref:AbrB/MazE/SpoVT family DNA-binding domain-containing protein n=1 Tax=uncultured Methanobrevibacter sp. TaxID=253161 RepID=UPI002600C308|nr:AbrB/MazE/SpoVT family DNA-binding domain-containing protein [uncultured Methanobrevibacter sp.]
MDGIVSSKIYKGFQTVIPSKIRDEIGITLEDTLNWRVEKDVIIVEVEKQRPLSDLAKFAISLDEETDVVDLKRRSGRGEL